MMLLTIVHPSPNPRFRLGLSMVGLPLVVELLRRNGGMDPESIPGEITKTIAVSNVFSSPLFRADKQQVDSNLINFINP